MRAYGQDVFEGHYRQHLSRRLLARDSQEDYERNMIGRLKVCSALLPQIVLNSASIVCQDMHCTRYEIMTSLSSAGGHTFIWFLPVPLLASAHLTAGVW
jgi:hypothetical protein